MPSDNEASKILTINKTFGVYVHLIQSQRVKTVADTLQKGMTSMFMNMNYDVLATTNMTIEDQLKIFDETLKNAQ